MQHNLNTLEEQREELKGLQERGANAELARERPLFQLVRKKFRIPRLVCTDCQDVVDVGGVEHRVEKLCKMHCIMKSVQLNVKPNRDILAISVFQKLRRSGEPICEVRTWEGGGGQRALLIFMI